MGALGFAGEGEQQAFMLRVGVLVAREEFNVSYIISVSCGSHILFFGMANISLSCHVLGVQSLPLAGGVGGARYSRRNNKRFLGQNATLNATFLM